jgi:chromosome segregation ATPase
MDNITYNINSIKEFVDIKITDNEDGTQSMTIDFNKIIKLKDENEKLKEIIEKNNEHFNDVENAAVKYENENKKLKEECWSIDELIDLFSNEGLLDDDDDEDEFDFEEFVSDLKKSKDDMEVKYDWDMEGKEKEIKKLKDYIENKKDYIENKKDDCDFAEDEIKELKEKNKKLKERVDLFEEKSGNGISVALNDYEKEIKELEENNKKYMEVIMKREEEIRWHEEENGCALGVEIGKLKKENKKFEEEKINLEEQNIQYIKWFAEINEICGAEEDDPAVESVKDNIKELKIKIHEMCGETMKGYCEELKEENDVFKEIMKDRDQTIKNLLKVLFKTTGIEYEENLDFDCN